MWKIIGSPNPRRLMVLSQLMQVCQRHLTMSETATALRPFYFVVHPDLFGQYPAERAVNENSMKHLQQHLESLHKQRKVAPSHVTFYIRNTADKKSSDLKENKPEGLRKVQVWLLAQSVRDTVKTLLVSCNLSLDYLATVPQNSAKPDRPIKWDPTFYDCYGIPNPFTPRRQPKIDDTLSSWLSRNRARAHANLSVVEPVRRQTTRMTASLRQETGLEAVRWDSSWGPAQFRACLLSFSRLYHQHQAEVEPILRGRTLVFSSEAGVSLQGAILLRIDDVPDTWLRVLRSCRHQWTALADMPAAEAALSAALGGVRIVRHTGAPSSRASLVLASEYLKQTRRLVATVRRHLAEEGGNTVASQLKEARLEDIGVVVKCATGSLSVSPQGLVLIPSSCPGFMVVDYLLKNATKIRNANREHHRSWQEKEDLINRVTEELSLLSLSRDQNVTWQQMEACCQRLVRVPRHIGVSLEGCRLKVAHFYSVMSDGEIYIPWNWKDDTD